MEKLPWQKELEEAEKQNVKIITLQDKSYPALLKKIYDPPCLLYAKGHLPRQELLISIVGTRTPSSYGLKTAEKFAYQLSSYGFTIVSGLARGIDTAAAWGTLKNAGKTIGVIGSGFNYFYPKENEKLTDKIIENGGAVFTEFPFSSKPEKWNFPRRNRIISGLSRGVIVIEAGQRSGALITANSALEQGREVFALPGQIDNLTSRGTNQLLRDGAILAEKPQDVLDALNLEVKKTEGEKENLPEMDRTEKKIFKLLIEKRNIEELIHLTGIAPWQLSEIMLNMQMKGIVKELPGKIYTRN
jgi:DNA processing protein